MDVSFRNPDASRRRSADALRLASMACLGLIPLAMVAADRSSPLILALAASLALAATGFEGRTDALLRKASRLFRTPLGAAASCFLLWSGLSVAWSPAKATSLRMLGELLLPVAAASILALTLPFRAPLRRAGWLFGAAAALACILIAVELRAGVGVRSGLGLRAYPFLFNRPTLTLLVLLPPLVDLALRLRPKGVGVTVGSAGFVLVAATVLVSYSGAAKLGLMAGAAAFVAAFLAHRMALAGVAVGLAGALALAPVWGDIADRLMPAALHERLAAAHARDRVDIWQSFGAAIREQPLVGAGFGVSGRFGETAAAARVAPEYRPFLDIGHPHNIAIQIWAELGVVGAMLALLVALLTLRALARLRPERLAPRLALFAAVFAVSLVGHGAWQGWWAAGIGAAVAWFRIIDQYFDERSGGDAGPRRCKERSA